MFHNEGGKKREYACDQEPIEGSMNQIEERKLIQSRRVKVKDGMRPFFFVSIVCCSKRVNEKNRFANECCSRSRS